jgi:hypothetical protein
MPTMNDVAKVITPEEATSFSRDDLAEAVRSMALLADLTISLWSGERTDAAISARLKADAGAVGNTGRYVKNLLAGCDGKLKDTRAAFAAARTMHYKLTLPWVSDPHAERQQGPRLLPNLLFQRYIDELTKLRKTATDKLADFIYDYPNLVTQAQANLAGLARAEDYPDATTVEAAFKLHFDFSPIPPASAFPNLPDDMLVALGRNLRKRQETAARSAEAAMWARVRELVGHLAARLKEPDAMLRETTLENVRELVTLLPGYNFTGDARVDQVVSEIGAMLDGVGIKEIRKDAALRGDVAARAQAINDRLSSWGL